MSERVAMGKKTGLTPALITCSLWCVRKLRLTPLWRKTWLWQSLELEKVLLVKLKKIQED